MLIEGVRFGRCRFVVIYYFLKLEDFFLEALKVEDNEP